MRHSKYEGYLVKLKDLREFKYTFTINGKVGDLINIGILFFDGNDYSPTLYNRNGQEMTGFLKKNFKNRQSFKFYYLNLVSYHRYFWDDNMAEWKFNVHNTGAFLYNCLEIPKDAEYDEVFFTMHYILFRDVPRELYRYPPSLLGKSIYRIILPNETVGIIPMQPQIDFNYLTYYINSTLGNIKASIVTCENYPLCDFGKEDHEKRIKINNFNSYSLSYSKKEIEKFTAISKKQNVLLLTCENAGKIIGCYINQNFFSDKDIFYIFPMTLYNRYSREGSEEKFRISQEYYKDTKIIYLNIELFSGDIYVSFNGARYEEYTYKNKKLYIIKNRLEDFTVTIKSYKASEYSISYYRSKNDDELHPQFIDPFKVGTNYLFRLNTAALNLGLDEDDNNFNSLKYYFSLHPINCQISISKANADSNNFDLLEQKEGFYQDIFIASERKYGNTARYRLSPKEKNDEACLFYITSYIMEDQSKFNKIILNTDFPQTFVFNSKNLNEKYIYPYVDFGKDVIIKYSLINGGI